MNISIKRHLIAASFILAGYAASGQGDPKISQVENSLLPWVQLQDSAELKYTIYDRMKYHHVPAVSVAVIDGGKIAWAKAYGLADVESNTPATEQTLFQAASISKSVNAVGVMRLVQEGKLSLDQDIRAYLKTWEFPDNDFTANKKITLQNLLSHTGGFNVHGFDGYKAGDDLPDINQILNGSMPANNEAVKPVLYPNTKYQYSGGGTVIIRKILEDNISKEYVSLMDRVVFTPLEMRNSTFAQPLPKELQKDAATAYIGDGDAIKGRWHIYPELAPDGLWTTPTDLAKLLLAIQGSLHPKGESFLNYALAERMLTPYLDSTKSALGFFVQKKGEEKFFRHDGGNEGFSSDAYASFDSGKGVVVMINSENYLLIDEIVNSVARVYDWPNFYQPKIKKLASLTDSVLLSYCGEYFFDSNSSVIVRKTGNHLEIKGKGEKRWEKMYPVSQTKFFIMPNQLDYDFLKGDSEHINILQLSNGRRTLQAVKKE